MRSDPFLNEHEDGNPEQWAYPRRGAAVDFEDDAEDSIDEPRCQLILAVELDLAEAHQTADAAI
jgi:hypothetical protein